MKKLKILLPAVVLILAIGSAFAARLAIVNTADAFNPLSSPPHQCQSATITVPNACNDVLPTGIRCKVLFVEPGSVAQNAFKIGTGCTVPLFRPAP